MPKRILTIAGSDTLSGGGIQADLATFSEYGVFGFSAITSIVTVVDGKFKICEVELELLKEQLETIFSLPDIAGIKIGLLPSISAIKLVGKYLEQHQDLVIVVDPVMVFKETKDIRMKKVKKAMKEYIFPYATIVTPNLVEARLLSELEEEIQTMDEMKEACEKIYLYGMKHVVLKGGERILGQDALDLLFDGKEFLPLHAPKIANKCNNGSGCTFSSAICANLVQGKSVHDSVKDAKAFVYEGIKQGIHIQKNLGNVWQGARRWSGSCEFPGQSQNKHKQRRKK